MRENNVSFEGVILQPISRKKYPWSEYNSEEDCLNFFQTAFIENIQNDFNVNHNTESFSDYFLIPYFTENKCCFGAYFIESGGKSSSDNYGWKYTIAYNKSFISSKPISQQDIKDEAEFSGSEFIQVGSTEYYILDYVPSDFRNYLREQFDKKVVLAQ